MSSKFLQIANVDLGGCGTPFTPIPSFTGVYDGGNYTIQNFCYHSAAEFYVGLFGGAGVIATFKNINMTGIDVDGGAAVGGLAGWLNNGSSVTNCTASGTVVAHNNNSGVMIGYNQAGSTITTSSAQGSVTGTSYVGGLAGFNGGTVSSSYSTVTVAATGDRVGGFIGENSGTGSISDSGYNGTITMSNNLSGGLTGTNYGSTVRSFSAGTLNGHGQIGGLTGKQRGILTNSYSFVTVASNWTVAGGLVGNNEAGPGGPAATVITNSYSASPSVTSPSNAGLFFGLQACTIVGSYYYDNGAAVASAAAGLSNYNTKAGMETQANYAGWDFTNVWVMPLANPLSPYTPAILSPVLRWQCGTNGIVCP